MVVDDCQGGVLVCTCMDTVDEEDDEEEEDGVDCVVPGKLDTVNAGLISSCRERKVLAANQHSAAGPEGGD